MMTKTLTRAGGLLAMLCVAGFAAAQSPVALETRAAELQDLSARLQQRGANDRRAVQAYAQRLGIQVRRDLPNGRVLELQRLVPDALLRQRPLFYITNNLDAADTVSTDEVWPGGAAGLDLDGSGMTVTQWDGGAVMPDHAEFAGRVTQVDGATTISGHSTHVAGTLISAGNWLLAESRGMAYAAHLEAYDWNLDTAEMAAAAALGQLVSNHSYGIAAGWLYIGEAPPDTWWWIGGSDPSDVEDPYFGFYDAESQLWDQIAFDAPYFLPVKAAGNDRNEIGPPAGQEYTVIDQDGQFLFTSTLPRNPDCWPGGYDCLPTHSVAKNILTVGAVDDLPGGYSVLSGPSAVVMADFSSWGPTDDGRIKPDLVGNGIYLYSTWPEYPWYALAAGTSMAAPNVSGSLILLQQHWQDLHGLGNFMRAATLKALAIHTADEAGAAPGPDYAFGWGLLNTRSAAEVITGDGDGHQVIEATLGNGSSHSYAFTVPEAGSTLTATLVWTDPPGTPVPLALDPPDLMLVNDLDLRITRTGSTWFPWVLDPAAPSAPATTGDNFRDNVEQVRVDGASSGTYAIEVSHKGALLDSAAQDYSLLVSVEPAPPTGSGLLIDEDFSGGLPPGWTVQTDRGASWTVRSPVPGDTRLDNNTGGTGMFAMVDNNYVNNTRTSLRTPVMDLSDNDAAILQFNSYFVFDELESIHVDVSTDGGAVWANRWQHYGFALSTRVSLDLSATVAGQPAVMIRFRYDSNGVTQGNLWQIDDIEFEVFGGTPPPGDPPGPAANPSPADGATDQAVEVDLDWTAGAQTDSHDVYFGTSAALNTSDLQGNQPGTGFDPGTLAYSTTYYWRIDEVNGDGTTTGPTWSFSTEAEPVPAGSLHLATLDGVAVPGNRGRWTASVTIGVANQSGSPESGVTVDGGWSGGVNGSASCTTDAGGACTVERSNLKQNVGSVTFTVANLAKSGLAYAPGDNQVADSVSVGPNDTDQVPSAADDSYQTGVDTPLVANVMENDDPGDGPAAIESHDLPANGGLLLAADGAFTYTPNAGFEGSDSFSYRLVDQDGDLSNTATVSITVTAGGPPPPPPPQPTLSATPYKDKGVQHVLLEWQGFTGTDVAITRNGAPLGASPVPNNGSFDDDIGVKGGGVAYAYEVCETGSTVCVGATATF